MLVIKTMCMFWTCIFLMDLQSINLESYCVKYIIIINIRKIAILVKSYIKYLKLEENSAYFIDKCVTNNVLKC